MMNGIIKHLRIYKKDVSRVGITIASINLLWFIRNYMPQSLFSAMMERKHTLVERKIKKVVGFKYNTC